MQVLWSSVLIIIFLFLLDRCTNCKFTTNEKELFLAHVTTCSRTKKRGIPEPNKDIPESTNITSSSKSDKQGMPGPRPVLTFTYVDEIYTCKTCDLTWTDKTQFVEHIVCHTTDSPYICLTCKQNFASRELIEIHSKKDHPSGNSKCGLMGIKKARLIFDELVLKKTCIVIGKLQVPETPRNEGKPTDSDRESPKISNQAVPVNSSTADSMNTFSGIDNKAEQEKTSGLGNFIVKIHGSDSAESALPVITSVHSLCDSKDIGIKEGLTTSLTSKQVSSNVFTSSKAASDGTVVYVTSNNNISGQSILVTTLAPLKNKETFDKGIPNRISTCTVPSCIPLRQPVDKDKEEHINSLFGELNKESNQIQPTNVSTKIQKIINVSVPLSTSVIGQPKYQVKQVTQYTPADITPAVSVLNTGPAKITLTTRMQGPPLLLIPVGPVIRSVNMTQAVSVASPQYQVPQAATPILSSRTSVVQSMTNNVSIAPKPTLAVSSASVNKGNEKELKASQKDRKLNSNQVIQKLSKTDKVFLKRPGYGYVCEACKKFTNDENIFKKHIWDHLHGSPLACTECSTEMVKNKEISQCFMTSCVVENVQNRVTKEVNVKLIHDGKKEIIEITDDDVNSDKPMPEIIVLDDEDSENDEKDQYQHGITDDVSKASAEKIDTGGKNDDMSKGICATQEAKGESVILPSETAEDNHVKEWSSKEQGHQNPLDKDILNESLGQTPEETDLFVSKVVESTLKEFDPNNEESEQKTCESDVQLYGSQHVICSASKKGDTGDSNEKINDFDQKVILEHSHDAFYVCGYEQCGFVCLSSQEYRNHLKSDKHQHEYCYVCGHCGQKDYVEDSHVRHMFAHSNVRKFVLCKCPVSLCKYKTNQIHLFKAHLKAHKQEELAIKCTYCHKSFPDITSLTDHFKTNLLKFISCPYCSFKLADKTVVREHVKLSHPDRIRLISVSSQIVCNEREINFYVTPKAKKQNQMDDEKNRDTLEESTSYNISEILKKVQNEKVTDIIQEEKETSADAGNSASVSDNDQVAKEKSPIETTTKNDSRKEAITLTIIQDKGLKSFRCPHCLFTSSNQTSHNEHVSLHDGEPERDKLYLCHLCPKGHNDFFQFKTHMINHEGQHDIKLFYCTRCTFKSNMKSHIMDHCRDSHETESLYTVMNYTVHGKVFHCKYCGFESTVQENVVTHEYQIHKVKPIVSVEPMQKEPTTKKNEKEEEQDSTEESGASHKLGGRKWKYHCDYCKNTFKHKKLLREHLQTEHSDIPNKQFVFFKCKYCSYTSTMKDLILSHIDEKHKGRLIRILRKIEKVGLSEDMAVRNSGETGTASKVITDAGEHEDKETVEVPDGNIFKTPFSCPKCSFSSNLRLETMRHIKTHSELKPVRPTLLKATARKSTSVKVDTNVKSPLEGKKNVLIQDLAMKIQNPFKSVKESVNEQNDSVKEEVSSPSKDYYILGEPLLHSALSACFIQLENERKLQCRICQQKIAKKFVLHRHILDHLGIVLFKCKYCNEGAIERTLLIGHIQKEHSFKPLQYLTVSKNDLENQFKERIFSQNFNDTISLENTRKRAMTPTDLGLKVKPVLEYNEIDSDNERSETDSESKPDEQAIINSENKLKCPKCRYIAKTRPILQTHIAAHDDPTKNFMCSLCDYRGLRINVIKHIYNAYHHAQAKTIEVEANPKEVLVKDKVITHESKVSEEGTGEVVENNDQKDVKVYEMKTKYKCKICGEKRDSRSAMYHHFKKSCKRPFYQCSLCNFQAVTKVDIIKHGRIRHSGKKVSVVDLPAVAKIKEIKIPVRQSQVNKQVTKVPSSKDELGADQDASCAESSEIRCLICKTFICENVMKLQYHINTVHQGSLLYCQRCPYKTPLVKHMLNHCRNVHIQAQAVYSNKRTPELPAVKSEENPDVYNVDSKDKSNTDHQNLLQCSMCELRLGSLKTLRRHLFRHFSYMPYSCLYCDKIAANAESIKKHIRKIHPKRIVKYKYNKDDSVYAKVNEILQKFKKTIKLQKPAVSGNSENKSARVESKKRSLEIDSETECSVSKAAKTELEDRKECSPEGFSGQTKPVLKYKISYNSAGKKIYCCLNCAYTSDKPKNLSCHFIRIHSHLKRRFKCVYCDYASNTL